MARRGGADPFALLERDLGQGPRAPVYLLSGDDDDGVRRAASRLKGLVDPDFTAFNLQVFSDRRVPLEELLNAARTTPMLQGPRVVVLQDLRELDFPKDHGPDQLKRFFADPPPDGIVVVIAPRVDARTNPARAFAAKGRHLRFERPREFEMTAWILRRAKAGKDGLELAPEAAEALAALVGTDTSRAASELEKLALYRQKGRRRVGLEELDAVVGPGRATGAFELDDALMHRDAGRALSVIRRRVREEGNRRDLVPGLLGQVARSLRNLLLAREAAEKGVRGPDALAADIGVHPFVAKKLWAALRRYADADLASALRAAHAADRSSKSSPALPEAILDPLILGLTGRQAATGRRHAP